MKNLIISLLFVAMLPINNYAQVAINETNATADPSSLLDVSSTTKGVLIPRVTTTDRLAIPDPANGLVVYDLTAQSFYYFNATLLQWVKIGSELNSWSLTGNAPTGTRFLGTINNTSLSFRTNNIERMMINSIGHVAIGTFGPTGGGYQSVGTLTNKKVLTVANGSGYVVDAPAILELAGSSNGIGEEIGMIDFINKVDLGNYNFARISAHKENSNPTHSSLRFYTRLGTPLREVMRINENGNVGINCTTPAATLHVNGSIRATTTINTAALACSDFRYKKDITNLSGSLDKLLRLNAVNYYWKQNEFPDWGFNDTRQVGFIAQELEAIFPELVVTAADGYKAVDYSKLTPVLVDAIKEQQVVIRSQNQDIQRLQRELDDLKEKVEKLAAGK